MATLFISSDLYYDDFCPVFENHFQTLCQVINVTFDVHLISFSCHGYLTFRFRLIIFQVTRLAKDNYYYFILFYFSCQLIVWAIFDFNCVIFQLKVTQIISLFSSYLFVLFFYFHKFLNFC